jgi:hypothetical protein
MKTCRAALGLCVALSLALGSTGPARAQTLGGFSESVVDHFDYLAKLITGGAYISGLGFAIGSILKFGRHKDNPTQLPIADPVTALAIGAYRAIHDSMSCPVFVGDSTLLAEDTCVWTKVTVGQENDGGANTDAVHGRVGGQLRIGPGWFVGGALGVGGLWMQTGAGVHQSGRDLDASVVLKRVDGPPFLAGAFSVSTSSSQYNLSGNGSVYIPAAPSIFMAGLRLRGAYEFPFEGWYLRPRTDVDIGYARTTGLQIVTPTATLTIDGASKTSVMFTPALEIGARFDVGPWKILRPYVIAGATILTDTGIPISGNFNGFYFSATSYGAPVIARVEAGLQFYEVKGWEMKMEYLLSAADSYLDQSFGLRAAKHF